MKIEQFEDLEIWQNSMELIPLIYVIGHFIYISRQDTNDTP
jgi:hypothetical protein